MEFFDVYCPACGPFKCECKRVPKKCPNCGNAQAITLAHSRDIDARFRAERERAHVGAMPR